jgi:flagellar motor switch/type III secretory pathway protein FliN
MALRASDVLLLPPHELTTSASGELLGAVGLVAPRGERGLGGQLAGNGMLVIRRERVETHSWDPLSGRRGSMPSEANATLEVIEDAPVVVRVELGTVEMTARQWAALGDGDVVTLGRRLGDPAILRVGGVEVARGEIVQVDGEYGVRIRGIEGRGGKE